MNEKEKLAREAALMTIKRVKSFEELNAKNLEEAQQKFVEATRRRWEKNFATHQTFRGGEYVNYPDFDAKIAFGLFRLAGFKINEREDVVYVMPGQTAENKINLDTGNKLGLKVEKNWENLTDTFDHHTQEAPLDTCTAKIVYQTLIELGLLEKNEALDRLIEFTSQIDNKNYSHQKEDFLQSDRTILGLHPYLNFKQLYEYFRSSRKPTELLSEEELQNLGLLSQGSKKRNRSLERQEQIEEAMKMIKERVSNGFEIETPLGKFFIEYISEEMSRKEKKGIPLRVDAVLAEGYRGLILYNQETESFFINFDPNSSTRLFLGLEGSKNVRGKMTIKPSIEKTPLRVSLREIIKKLGGDPEKTKGKLKEALEKNDLWINIFSVEPKLYKGRAGRPDHWGIESPLSEKYRKHAIFPPDFKPEKGFLYRVRIVKDTQPSEKNKGAYLLKVVGKEKIGKKEEKEEKETKTYIVKVQYQKGWVTDDIGQQEGKPGKIGLFPKDSVLDTRCRYKVKIVEEKQNCYILEIIEEIKLENK